MRKAVPPPHRFRPPRRRPPPRHPRHPPPRWCATANPNARPQRALARRPEGSADLHATDGKGSAGILMAASPESFPATRLSLSPMQILQQLYKPTIITRPRPFLSTLQLLPPSSHAHARSCPHSNFYLVCCVPSFSDCPCALLPASSLWLFVFLVLGCCSFVVRSPRTPQRRERILFTSY